MRVEELAKVGRRIVVPALDFGSHGRILRRFCAKVLNANTSRNAIVMIAVFTFEVSTLFKFMTVGFMLLVARHVSVVTIQPLAKSV